jgi:multidrug efflux pump subunit AcrA (membrane-fusion protein)
MFTRVKGGWYLACTAVLLFSTACSGVIPRLGSSGDDPTTDPELTVRVGTQPSATPPSVVGGRQVVPVRKGAIAEVLTFSGRIGGRDEVAVTFPARSKVDSILVKVGQAVDKGQVLVEADSRDAVKDLVSARARLETSTLRLEHARMDAENRARDGGVRAQLDQARLQGAVVDAQSELQRTQADFERVRAGASPSERQSAESAVLQAQSAVDRAQIDLDTISAGADPAELREATQRVSAARLALQKAEADRTKATTVDADQVRVAERDVATAQAAFDRAKSDLDNLTKGPDQFAIRAAEREVQQAQSALQTAQSTNGDVAMARRLLGDAQDRLAKLKEGPRQGDVDVARATVQAAQLTLDSARARLEQVRKGADKLTIDSANAAVDSALATFESAESRLAMLQEGSPQDRIEAARTALDRATSSLAIARARLQEVNSRPTPAELKEAQARVSAAQASLDRATLEAATREAFSDSANGPNLDLELLQRTVEQDKADVAALQKSLDNTHLVAPIAGVVSALSVRANESVEAGRPVLAIAPTDQAVMRATVADEREGERLTPGQGARVHVDGMDGEFSATLLGLTDLPNGGGRIAQLSVEWPSSTAPAFGVTGTTSVLVQQKADTIVVPQKAVRTAGPRRYVEFLEGTNRRVANVELGISGDKDVEILSGLREGQFVLVAP